jgi:DNA repair exonuclease SbcCD ATPase subunit
MAGQTTIFTFEARDKNLGALIEANRERLRRLNAEFKKVDEGTQEYKDLAVQIAATKEETRKLTDEQKKLNREFAAMDVPTDSLAGLRIEYAKLNDQIAKLSAAERNSQFGKKLIADSANVKKQIDGVEQSFGRFTGNVGNYRSAFDGLVGGISKVGFVVGGLFAALQGGSAIVQATRETEKFFAVLKNAVGSETAAKQIFADLQEFAATTPFQLNELVNSFTKLENRNFNPTIEQLRTMGDIAASSGKSIDQFVDAILDAQTGEFERLKEFGIVAKKNGDELNVSFRGQTTTLKNTSEAITDYLLELGKLPGIQGAASAVAKTLDGSISNLEDNMTRLFATIGSGGGVLKATVDGFNFLVGAVNDFLSVPLSEEIENEKNEFNALAVAVQAAGEGTETRTMLIQKMQTEYPGFLANLDAEKVTNEQLALAIAETNLQFQKKIVLAANEERLAEAAKKVTEVVNEQTDAILRQGRAIESQEERRRIRESQQETQRDPTTGRLQFRASDATVEEAQAQERLGNIIDDTQQKITDATNEQAKLQQQLSDTFFQLFGQTEEQARAELGLSEVRKKGSKEAGDAKDKNDAVAGSIRFLNEQIDELQKKIQNTPLDSPLLEKLVTDLDKAQKELKKAEQAFLQLQFKAKFGRELTAPDLTDGEQPTIEIIPELKVDADAKKDAKEKAAELKRETERGLEAIEFPIAVVLPDEEQRALDAFNEQRKKADEDYYANQQKLADEAAAKEEQRREQLKQAAINAASQIADATFAIQQNRVDREEQIAIQALENEYNRKIEKAGGNAKKVAALEKELAAKREAIEKESAKKRKKIAKTEAIIQGALSVVEALPDLVLAAFAAAATIAQIAVIDSQEFAEGGFPEEKKREQRKRLPRGVRLSAASNKLIAAFSQAPGGYAGAGIAPPDSTGRRPAGAYMKNGQMIVYHEGEYIAPASQVARHPEVFNFLETERKQVAKPFAKGGYSATAQPEYIAPASQVAKYPHLFGALNGEVAMSGYKERFPAMDRLVNRPEYGRASISFATGGFTTVPPPAEVKAERVVKVEAGLSEEQFRLLVETLSKSISTETGKEVRNGIALGLNDNNRQSERIAALGEQRTV